MRDGAKPSTLVGYGIFQNIAQIRMTPSVRRIEFNCLLVLVLGDGRVEIGRVCRFEFNRLLILGDSRIEIALACESKTLKKVGLLICTIEIDRVLKFSDSRIDFVMSLIIRSQCKVGCRVRRIVCDRHLEFSSRLFVFSAHF